ncbi:MAG: phosphatidate cytidylyltransferase [Planctomycetota bacterium]
MRRVFLRSLPDWRRSDGYTLCFMMLSNLKKRLIISGNLITAFLFLLVFDHYLTEAQTGFYFILAVFSSLCFYEFTKLYGNINIKLPWQFPVVTGLCGIIIIWMLWTFPRTILRLNVGAYLQLIMWDMPMLASFVIFIIVAIVYYLKKRITDFSNIIILSAGFVYVYLPIWSIARMRAQGVMLVIYFVALVKITDSIAYFWGTRFGKHKLAEHISPNKTVEGFIAGLIGASFIGMGIFYLILPATITRLTPFWLIFIINFVIVFVAQIGDLLESYIKRTCKVKDSGQLLGPLGGILDLADSLLLAAPPAAYLLLKLC